MANRRMFSLDIVDSDAFLDMPASAQNLYFHLGMRADDDGFISSPKKTLRVSSATPDDYKILVVKRFVLELENGICVIKHWGMNNYIRADRYKPTVYIEQKKRLKIKENGAYTDVGIPEPNQRLPQERLGKVRLGKDREKKLSSSIKYLSEIPQEDLKEITTRFSASEKQIIDKGESLKLYCESKGRKYKNYKSFLLNAIKKDFPEREHKQKYTYKPSADGKSVEEIPV